MTARVLQVDPDAPAPDVLAVAAAALRAGELVAFPTETVYGLGAHALRAAAVRRIFAAKGRPADNPLIVHLAAAAQLRTVVAELTPLAETLAAAHWPGPLTLVLTAGPAVPEVVTGGLRTVAVRVPGHPVALALLRQAGVPVAAPSANRSGRPSPTTAAHALAEIGGAAAIVIDGGRCPVGLESTVVDARGARPVILREGGLARERLAVPPVSSTAGEPGPPDAAGHELPASPGTRHRHYQPRCRVVIAAPGEGPATATRLTRAGHVVGLVAPAPAPAPVVPIATVTSVAHLARELYWCLHRAEEAGVDVVVVEGVAEQGLGRAIMDRLRRAAQ